MARKRRRKGLRGKLLLLLGLLVGIGLVLYAISGELLNKLTEEGLALATSYGRVHGIRDAEPWFEEARVSSFRSVTWYGVGSQFTVYAAPGVRVDRRFRAEFDSVTLRVMNLAFNQFQLDVRGFIIHPIHKLTEDLTSPNLLSTGSRRQMSIEGNYLRITFNLNLRNLEEDAKVIIDSLSVLARGGRIPEPIEFDGVVSFFLGEFPVKVRAGIEETDEGGAFVLNSEDLHKVSQHFEEALSVAEVDIIAKYPLEAATLLRVKEESESAARGANMRDSS
ncbi:hypothetical protein OAO01_08640, partial [Oligoflexia bacterium]|nr:hypothetical protein [Oligoflexia bacterium]